MTQTAYHIGLMSGTSMDGVDAVLAAFDGSRWLGACGHAFVPYSGSLKQSLLALQHSSSDELHRSRLLAQQLADLNAQAVAAVLANTGMAAAAITSIGCHGQTIRHAPEHGYSLQLMDYARLAERSGITTVGDFRSPDLAAGGQGAPLTPAFHQALFAADGQTRVVLNLGGIANISVLPPAEPGFGFDTGPANMLMDAWVMRHWQQAYDADGRLAASGRLLPDLLAALLDHPYFARPHPKSTGRDLFSLPWLQGYLKGSEAPADVLHTLLHLTARSVADAVCRTVRRPVAVYACGGGTANRLLMQVLADCLQTGGHTLDTTATLGVPPQQVEAAAFAWLAACWCQRTPVAVHHATGAAGARILGCGYWAAAPHPAAPAPTPAQPDTP